MTSSSESNLESKAMAESTILVSATLGGREESGVTGSNSGSG